MAVSEFSKNTFSLIALMSAAWLPVWGESAPVKEIPDAASLREVLTATEKSADGTAQKALYDGYTLKITPAELIVPVDPGIVSASNPNGTVIPVATNVLLTGNGSASTLLRSDGAGDLFGFGTLAYSFSNLTISGAGTGADNADGRFAILAAASVTVKGDTVFSDRFFSANEKTSNAASGGIFYSSNTADVIVLDAGSGAITFSGITTYGDTLTLNDPATSATTENKNAAAGGVAFLNGSLKVQGGNAVNFSGNKAESKDADAFGGAVYVTSSQKKPEEYGMFLGEGTYLNFNNNHAIGESAQGGAMVFVSGAINAKNSHLAFSGNTASARTGTAVGGAWVLASASIANFDANSELSFSNNRAETLGECNTAAGGALYLENSTLKSAAGTLSFSKNAASASADGSSALGGAIIIAGENALAEFTGTSNSVFAFSENSVSVAGKSMEKQVEENGATATVNFVPEALGGAIAATGGKLNISGVGKLDFSGNSASVSVAGTRAAGGAVYLGGAKTEALFSESGTWKFLKNSASANGAGTASGGAIAQDAGTLKADFSSSWIFEKNTASGTASGNETIAVSGGAIAQMGGTQSYTATGAAKLVFSENAASVSSEISGSSARGGAVAQLSRNAKTEISGAADFSGNSVSTSLTAGGTASDAVSLAAGGAIYSAGTLALGDATFTKNTATTYGANASAQGGAIYLSGATLSARDLRFENNRASATDLAGTTALGSARGGAIYLSSGTFDAQSVDLRSNNANGEISRGGAVYSGGAFFVKGNAGFDENFVTGTREASGGALYLTGTFAAAGGADFSNNRATASGSATALGGAVYAAGSLEITGAKTTVSGNAASSENGTALGGAFYLKGGNYRLDNATISGNTATGTTALGGAIYIDASGNAATTLTLGGNTTVSGNTANGAADGISVGNGISPDAISKNVNLNIASGATFSTTTDAEGNEVTTRESFETVTLSDPLRVALKGADFTLEKTNDGGDFIWSGDNEVKLESVSQNGTTLDGKFNLAFRSGETALANGFSLTGTRATNVAVDAEAKLTVSSGATFCNFASMTLDGTLEVAGTVNLSDSEIRVGTTGKLIFGSDALSEVSGKNTVTGALTTRGNATFNAVFPNGETEASLAVSQIHVEKNGTVSFVGGSNSTPFNVTTDAVYFAESGTLALGAGTKLLLNSLNAIDPENELNIAVSGAGTLVLLDKTEKNDTIAFNSYYDSENKKLVASHFSVGFGVKIESGIFIAAGTTLDLAGLDYKNVVVDGGTLSASGSAANPLKIETLSVTSSATFGDGKTTQVIELLDSLDDNNVATKQRVSLSGDLKILEGTTLVAGARLQNYASAGVSGAGTLQGDVSGSGKISVAKIAGNVSVASNDRTAFSGATHVTGNVTNAGRLTLEKGARVSTAGTLKNEVAGQLNVEGETSLGGNITNAGTLTFSGNSVIESGSRLTQTEAGRLVINPGAGLDVSAIAGTDGAISLAGTLVITPADYAAGEEFTGLAGLQNGQLDGLKITDSASNLLTDRFMWNDAIGSYVFLGLNGRKIETTLYGDLVRENVFRIYDFMRAGLEHGKVASIHPSVFGEKKETSRYMRKYLERKNRFNPSDDKPGVPAPVNESAPGEFGRAAEALTNNFWVQTQYGHTNANARENHLDYGIHSWGALLGSSVATSSEDEVGAVFGYSRARMKHSGENAHKIDIDAYELMGFYRHVGESYDGTLALSGAYAMNDSERGNAEADFNSWQLGMLAEGGVTFRPEAWCEIRPYAALRLAYSRTDSFREKGDENAFKVDAADTFAARGTFGLSWAFLPFDSTQITLRAGWNLDLGDSVIDVDAYQYSTRSDLKLTSREAERSSFDLGAYLNYRVNTNVSLYTGYTGILRSGHEEHRADLGVNVAF